MASGCRPTGGPPRPWSEFVQDLNDLDRVARLDTTGNRLYSSFDPTGGNDDFNRYSGPGSELGWVTIVDLKGPGCIRRFWITGLDHGHPFKLYFDGENKPRFSGTIDELFGDTEPFHPPLARYQNNGWWSYVPITFAKSLRIETLAPPTHPFWGPRKLFHHINVETYDRSKPIQSMPFPLTGHDRAALAQAATKWQADLDWPQLDWNNINEIEVQPGTTSILFQAEGPGVVRSLALRLQPADPTAWTQQERNYLLQDAVLTVTYDQQSQPSIHVPVSDFFGNAWRERHYGSALLASSPQGWLSRWPMPYARHIQISLVNQSDRAVRAAVQAKSTDDRQPSHGYLHTNWRRSGPFTGFPHPLADFKGRGKFVGCFLGVTGEDNSWWLLEGDETMVIDQEVRPSWRGTGLEDYFNGSWYYRGTAFAAYHGVMDRSPFRVAQYRHHLVDPVHFQKSFHMDIERGDLDQQGIKNGIRGTFQSVTFAYLDQPTGVTPCFRDRQQRRAPFDRYARQTFMLQLFELERMNNFGPAHDLITEYMQTYPGAEENGIYKLRQLEYRHLLGEKLTADDYKPFVVGQHGLAAAEQARILTWFHESTNRALIGMCANGDGIAYLDGQKAVTGDHPFQLFVTGIELTPGPHVLAAQVTMKRAEPWIQMSVLTSHGLAGSGLDTLQTQTPDVHWNTGQADPAAWKPTRGQCLLRGTPDAPFIGGVPNAFPLLQSKAYSIRLDDWGYVQGTAYFRLNFNSPLAGWPHAAAITGLDR